MGELECVLRVGELLALLGWMYRCPTACNPEPEGIAELLRGCTVWVNVAVVVSARRCPRRYLSGEGFEAALAAIMEPGLVVGIWPGLKEECLWLDPMDESSFQPFCKLLADMDEDVDEAGGVVGCRCVLDVGKRLSSAKRLALVFTGAEKVRCSGRR